MEQRWPPDSLLPAMLFPQVVDNSSAFRMTDGVPLVIPEVNPEAMEGIEWGSGKGAIVANPNCSTIIALMAVTPLHKACPVRRMVVSTYQAASGAGQAAMDELALQTREVLDNKPVTKEIFPFQVPNANHTRPINPVPPTLSPSLAPPSLHLDAIMPLMSTLGSYLSRVPDASSECPMFPCRYMTSVQYAFNLFSHNAPMMENGYNEEEMKMVKETRKIWSYPDIQVWLR